MATFEFKPQRSGAIAVTKYRENDEHVGAVAILEPDPRRGATIRVVKPINIEGLRQIVKQLREDYANLIKGWDQKALAGRADTKVEAEPPVELTPETSEV